MPQVDSDEQENSQVKEQEVEEVETEPEGESQEGEAETKSNEERQDEEVVITLGESSPDSAEEEEQKPAPEWLKELRKSNREKDRQIRELKQQIEAKAEPEKVAGAPGPKPKLEDSDYDAEEHDRKLEAWYAKKAAHEDQQRVKQAAEESQKKAWEERVAHHNKLKSALKVRDYEDAEAVIDDMFNVTQQGILIHCAEDSAKLKYALGKSPKIAKDLASIEDPAKFTYALAKLETKLKVEPRKAPPLPERVVRGNTAVSGSVDQVLERLRAEADRTGDRTKVAAYMREVKAKKA